VQARICNGCQRVFPASEIKRGRCAGCERRRNRERTLHEANHRAYSSKRWQRTRAVVRARERNRCRYASPECRGRLEVHHVKPAKAHSGLFFALDNLELVCRHHHEVREREARARTVRQNNGPVRGR
jgi:5-methylcytosine-specific restriction endonuclease McrA